MIRPAAVSGMFYPSHPAQLRASVESLIKRQSVERTAAPLGLVVPHAGYEYSGSTAAAAFARVPEKKYNTVVIIGPSHREYFEGVSIYNGDSYLTPLGEARIDTDLRSRLIDQSEFISASVQGHRDEHSIEVQVPFIQVATPGSSILPMVVGRQHSDCIRSLGRALADVVLFDDTLIVASSDLSHFHSLEEAEQLDSVARDAIEHLNPDLLLDTLQSGATEACGGGPVAAMLYAALAHGATNCTILDQTTSADVTRDVSRVVGYLAAAVYKN